MFMSFMKHINKLIQKCNKTKMM